MPGKEFEIARKLMQERWADAAPEDDSHKTPGPAVFREIDGRELARQYVAHRKLIEAESLAHQPAKTQAKAHEDPVSGETKTKEDQAPAPPTFHRRVLGWLLGLWRT